MRKFWFDLPEAIGRAEETIAGHQAHPASEPPSGGAPRSTRPATAAPITATHIDVPPAGEPAGGEVTRQ